MSEIENMYKNAGVKYYKEICAIKNVIDKVGNKECYFEVCCTSCPLNKTSFISEKQIELIKWLGKLAGKLEINSNYNDTQYLLYFYLNRDELPNISTGRSENFEESLAELINSLWSDLTEKEKEQIRTILND